MYAQVAWKERLVWVRMVNPQMDPNCKFNLTLNHDQKIFVGPLLSPPAIKYGLRANSPFIFHVPFKPPFRSIIPHSCFISGGYWLLYTRNTAQGGGGSFKNRKPIGEVGCCESRMAERSHWWTERWLRSPLFLSLSLSFSLFLSLSLTIYLPTHLPTYLSIYLSFFLPIYLSFFLSFYLSIYPSFFVSIDLSIYQSIYLSNVSMSLSHLMTDLSIYLSVCLSICLSIYLI